MELTKKNIVFKKAGMEDYDIAFDFIEKLWATNTYDKEGLREVYRNVTEDKNSFAFFALEDGVYRGFCHGAYFNTFWLSGMTCYLSSIITAEDVRGQGYGVILMDEARRMAEERGCHGIVLDSAFYRKPAHAFYEEYGFEKGCYGFDLILK